MEEVWRRGSVTVRDVMTALNADGAGPRAYTTYMTVLVRLHGKGLLDRRREGKTNHYTPAVAARALRRVARCRRCAGRSSSSTVISR